MERWIARSIAQVLLVQISIGSRMIVEMLHAVNSNSGKNSACDFTVRRWSLLILFRYFGHC